MLHHLYHDGRLRLKGFDPHYSDEKLFRRNNNYTASNGIYVRLSVHTQTVLRIFQSRLF